MPRKNSTGENGYNGNSNLPLASYKHSFTENELREFIKCEKSPAYFINTYVQITNVDRGLINFEMYPFQEQMIEAFEKNRYVICKLARQSGKSSVVVQGYFLWYILFHTDVSVALLANKEQTAIQLLDRLKESFEALPLFLKQGVAKWDQKLIKLGNKARVRAEATSESAIRGDSFNIVFLDEFAFVPENIAEKFVNSVFPTISSGQTTKIFIVSTPKGYNLFWRLWNESGWDDDLNKFVPEKSQNGFVPISFTWKDVPLPERHVFNEDGDNVWEKQMRAKMQDGPFEQEFNCSFMGSANTLIPMYKLQQMKYKKPVVEMPQAGGPLKVYTKPVYASDDGPGHVYVICVDTGQGQGLDSSVAQVIDISEQPFKQVAVWRDNKTVPQLFAPVVHDLARMYNNAFVLCEINVEGFIIADTLHMELEYENVMTIFPHPKKGQLLSGGFNAKSRLGLKVTEATKKIGCSGLKTLILKDKLIVNDYQTYFELTRYVAVTGKTGLTTYKAEPGTNDDCVAALVLLGWLSLQTGFENYVGLSMRQVLMEGHDAISFDTPIIGILGDYDLPATVGRSAQGFEIVEDSEFWRDENKNWL
jgi:hypothetical protein